MNPSIDTRFQSTLGQAVIVAALFPVLGGLLGCGPAPKAEPPEVTGPFSDVTTSRLVSSKDAAAHAKPGHAGAHLHGAKKADWAYRTRWSPTSGRFTGDSINGSPGVTMTTDTSATCSDLLVVPIDNSTSGIGPNVIALTNLYTGCPEPHAPDPNCSPNADGHCPTRAWSQSLAGALKGNGITFNLAQTEILTVTTTGLVYRIRRTDGALLRAAFDTRADIGVRDATFTFSGVWVDYPGNYAYVAASYAAGTKTRLYKLDVSAAATLKVASLDIVSGAGAAGNSSLPIAYDGFVYLTTFDGQVHKVDASTFIEVTSGGFPVNPGLGRAVGSPTIDSENGLLFTTAGDSLVIVRLDDGSFTTASLDGDPACVGGSCVTPSVSSVALDFDTHAALVGHEERLWRVAYDSSGQVLSTTSKVLASAGASGGPTSSPLVWRPTTTTFAFIGDFEGRMNQVTLDPSGSLGAQLRFANGDVGSKAPRDARMESPIVLDYTNGNLYFGDDSAVVYQVSQAALE